jgi:hypothetical protein
MVFDCDPLKIHIRPGLLSINEYGPGPILVWNARFPFVHICLWTRRIVFRCWIYRRESNGKWRTWFTKRKPGEFELIPDFRGAS